MSGRYGNTCSRLAEYFTGVASARAPILRWTILLSLVVAWIGAGMFYWLSQQGVSFSDAFYRTIGAISLPDSYFDANDTWKQIMRFAAVAVSVVGILFAFSGQLGRSLAQLFTRGAANHIVITGSGAAALSLALDCDAHGDSVILIARDLPEDTSTTLRQRGVIVIDGDPTRTDILKSSRVRSAAHVVAFETDDGLNLEIEAATRVVVGDSRQRDPLDVHVATHAPMLLREARAMRARQITREGDKPSIDAKPFSLDEMGARVVIQDETITLLNHAAELKQDRLHLVFFGFDEAGEALAVRALMSLWSARFEAPRVTVLTPDAARCEKRVRARYPEAFTHPELWTADIAFQEFDWETEAVDPALLDHIAAARGPATAVFVTTSSDTRNIQLALSLKRACNIGRRWPVPIYMKESSKSEFSQQYARGDENPGVLDAYLKAFGSHQALAKRDYIVDGWLDRGAAVAHEAYNKGMKPGADMRQLQAAMKDWGDVLETYRAANRAVADGAMVKVWDAGWRVAGEKEKGDTAPQMPADMLVKMAQTEHNRWMAERLLSGWHPAAERNNELLAHDKLTPWSALGPEDHARDETQVRAAVDIARMMNAKGFVAR